MPPASKRSSSHGPAASRQTHPAARPPARTSKRKSTRLTPAVSAASPAGSVPSRREAPDFPALLHYVRQGRCALFVGAGLSAGAGLPDWRDLMLRVMLEAAPFAAGPSGLRLLDRTTQRLAARWPDVINPLSQNELLALVSRVLSPPRARELFGARGGIDIHTETSGYPDSVARIRQDSALYDEMRRLLDAGKYAELAGFCRDTMGRRLFHTCLREALQTPTELPPTHRAIVRTPYACIVTTNFDRLLEHAYGTLTERGVPKVPTGAELAQHGTLLFDEVFFILKAHGDIDDEASIVLTSDDYRRIIHASPAFQATLSGILQRHALLFVGYSLSDVNFRLLLDNQLTIFNGHVPPRYAIMDGVGQAEREILWRTAKLRVIGYEKGRHDEVGRFLAALADASTAKSARSSTAKGTRPARRVLEPAWGPRHELGILAHGDRIVVDLTETRHGQPPRRLWSGGTSWPDYRALRRRVASLSRAGSVDLSKVSEVGSYLADVMPAGLMDQLGATNAETVVLLSLSPATELVPWEWLIVSGSPLCLRNPVVRRPVGISDKSRGLRLPLVPLRALVIGDAGAGAMSDTSLPLPGSAREAREIAALLKHGGHAVTTLTGTDATYGRLMDEVAHGDYDIVHVAGHAGVEGAESFLALCDGIVTSSELASILYRRPPALLVLNSHSTAFAYAGAAADADETPPGVDRPLPPSFGFTDVAGRCGVGAFVGSFSSGLHDETAAEFALAFFEHLLSGARFAEAVHQARRVTIRQTDTTGLFFIASGCAELRTTDSVG